MLSNFEMASGLHVNYDKSSAVIIRGDATDSMVVKHILLCELGSFPCKYLSLQLSTKQLTKVHWQPALDQIIAMLSAWQRGLLEWLGGLILIKAIVSARPVHQLMVMDVPTWVFEEIDSWARSFFWVAKDQVTGGQCLVSWQQICRPIKFGGLGVKNFRLQGLALRVRWEWLRRTDPDRPWQGLPMVKDSEAAEVFDSLVCITVGNGAKTLFWRDRWIRGASAESIAPLVCAAVGNRCANSWMVKEAIVNNR